MKGQGKCSPVLQKSGLAEVRINQTLFISSSGGIKLQNTLLSELECDTLYHLGLDNKNHDLVKMFGDVRFVIMGGSSKR